MATQTGWQKMTVAEAAALTLPYPIETYYGNHRVWLIVTVGDRHFVNFEHDLPNKAVLGDHVIWYRLNQPESKPEKMVYVVPYETWWEVIINGRFVASTDSELTAYMSATNHASWLIKELLAKVAVLEAEIADMVKPAASPAPADLAGTGA